MGIIGSIRKHSWIAVLIVGIAIVCFIIGDLTKNRKQEAFAKIDGDEITYEFYNSRLAQRSDEIKEQTGRDMSGSYAFKDAVWQEILQERVLGKEMDALGIIVTDEEFNDMYFGRFVHPWLKQQFTNPQTGEFDVQNIINYETQMANVPDTALVKRQWLNIQRQMRDDRQQSKYFTLLNAGIYMPSTLANAIAEIDSKSSDIRIATLLYGQAGDIMVDLTDADYQKYFDEHKKEINFETFRLDNRERREVVYAVFNTQPSQTDLKNIETEVGKWWEEIQKLNTEGDDDQLVGFINMRGGFIDTNYYSRDIFAYPFDTVFNGAHAGKLISPMVVQTLSKSSQPNHSTYGQFVTGKIMATEMRPDSIRTSVIIIPTQNSSVEAAAHLRDSAMAAIKGGMPFEEAVVRFSADTTKGGDQDWQRDGMLIFNWEAIHHNLGDVFNYDLPNERGHIIVKVTGKTAPKLKYRLALAIKDILPSNQTDNEVRDRANQFANQYTTCKAMIEGAQKENIQLSNAWLYAMSDSLNGYSGTRDAIQWAFDENTLADNVSGEIYHSDFSYNDEITGKILHSDYCHIVVAVRDILVPNELTVDQARQIIERPLRMEKLGEKLVAKAKEAMKGTKDINEIADKLGIRVDTVTNVTFLADRMGANSMEPKALATIAAKKGTGLIEPVQGSWGVHIINIDGSKQVEKQDVNTIRNRYTNMGAQGINYVLPILQNRMNIIENGLRRL